MEVEYMEKPRINDATENTHHTICCRMKIHRFHFNGSYTPVSSCAHIPTTNLKVLFLVPFTLARELLHMPKTPPNSPFGNPHVTFGNECTCLSILPFSFHPKFFSLGTPLFCFFASPFLIFMKAGQNSPFFQTFLT